MGVWNATCTVSHLPILENEPCTGFLITFGNKTGDTCYPDDRFRVLSPAIHGLYNGYGSLRDIQNPESLLKTIQTERIFEDDGSCGSLEDILRNAADGQLRLSAKWRSPFAVGNQVFLALVKNQFLTFARTMYAESAANVRRLQNACRACEQAGEHAKIPELFHQMTYLLSPAGYVHRALSVFLNDGHDISDIAALNKLMLRTRQEWLPPTACGSQTEIEDRDQLCFYHLVASVADEMAADYMD